MSGRERYPEEYDFATKDEALAKAELLRASIEAHGYEFEKISAERSGEFTDVWKTTTAPTKVNPYGST